MFDIPLLNNLLISSLNLFISVTELKNNYSKHLSEEHKWEFKIDKVTYSKHSAEQRITLSRISLQCFLNNETP